MKKLIFLLVITSIVGLGLEYLWFNYFSSPGDSDDLEVFVVPQDWTNAQTIESLYQKKYIKNIKAFNFLFTNFSPSLIKSGGYRISRNMNSWQVVKN